MTIARMALWAALASSAVLDWKPGDGRVTMPKWTPDQGASIAVRLRVPAGGTMLDLSDGSGRAVGRLESADGELQFALFTDANPAPLRVSLPVAALGAGTRSLTIRYSRAKLDLFAGGVLVDEEWPMGSVAADGGLQVAPSDAVEGLSVWNRGLSDSEIAAAAGGAEAVLRRRRELLGEAPSAMQYFRPLGFNASAGDAMPFFHDGRFHVYYLFDRRHHRSKWGLGAHQWAHVSSTDLVHWEQHPMALSITDEREASICTGSVFWDKGTYYAFYATRLPDRSERLGMATSADGIRFTKVLPTPFAEPAAPYRRGPNRDPFAFRTEDGLYRLLVTAELADPAAASRGGALACLASSDLRHWTVMPEPFLLPGYAGHQPECADYFKWGDWYYLLFGQDGATRYRMSRGPAGPWLRPAVDIFDGPQLRVMKTAAFTGNRRLGVAFLPESGWGGRLVFRELVQHSDGTLGTRFPAELIPPGGEPVAAGRRIRVEAPETFAMAALDGIPPDLRISVLLRPSPNTAAYGLALRGSGKYEQGIELRLQPPRKKVEWRPVDARSLAENEMSALYQVEGLDGPVRLEIVTKGEVVDVSINGERTLVHRAPRQAGGRLFFFAQNGGVAVEKLELWPIK